MPRNPNIGGSKMADAVCKMIDLQNELKRDIEALVDLKKEIMNTIRLVTDAEQQTLLEKRYLCFLSWEKIAVEMHYSIQHIYRMHDEALNVVDTILAMRVNESE
jgi:DNA-directed RNA polymerase specialized sigma subunit